MISDLYKFHNYASDNIEDYPAEFGIGIAKIHYVLDLDEEGNVLKIGNEIAPTPMGKTISVIDKKGKEKKELIYKDEMVPIQQPRTSGVFPYFLCDDYKYILGLELYIDNNVSMLKLSQKGKKNKFEKSKELHLKVLSSVDNEISKGIINYFKKWNPEEHLEEPKLFALAQSQKGSINIGFRVNGKKAHENGDILNAWKLYYTDIVKENNQIGTCSIIGKDNVIIGRLHNQFSGIRGASSTGASLICFNSDAHCSYGKKQAYNSPVSVEVIEGYGKALQYLIDHEKYNFNLNGKTFLCWSEKLGIEIDFFNSIMNINNGIFGETEILNTAERISRGLKVEFKEQELDPNIEFSLLGLSPANGRLFVNLYYRNTFGSMIEKINNHYKRMELINSKLSYPAKIIRNTIPLESKNTDSDLGPLLVQSIIEDKRYPAPIFNKIIGRIRADKEIRWDYSCRVAFIKAYLLKNSSKLLKEVLTVELNKETTYIPYILGRLFAQIEYIQTTANKNLNTTIKDRYFDGACATPSIVFPTILQLSNKHLSKIGAEKKNWEVALNKELGNLISKITTTLPNHLDLEDQGVFIIGYYHQMEELYSKKDKEEE